MASPTRYNGPSAREMIETHTLAQEIIARADDTEPVLDADELALLKRFLAGPESKVALLNERDIVGDQGDDVVAKARNSGSLVTYIIAQSVAGQEILGEEEVEMLKKWFERT